MLNLFKAFKEQYSGRYYILFLSLIMLFILRPFLEDFFKYPFILDIFLSLVLFSGVYAVCENRFQAVLSTVVAALSIGIWWSAQFYQNRILDILSAIMGIIFFYHIALTIFYDIFSKTKATINIIFGALCAYFMIGFGWGFVYILADLIMPGSFQIAEAHIITFSDYSYYSFVTLTTLGYGDITPLTNATQMMSVLEAAFGQFYLAILIAGLVGKYISQKD